MKLETNIGEVNVKKLSVVEGREILIYMALLKADTKLSLRDKAVKINDLYFERLTKSTGLDMEKIGLLDSVGLSAVEDAYSRLNSLEGEEKSDF